MFIYPENERILWQINYSHHADKTAKLATRVLIITSTQHSTDFITSAHKNIPFISISDNPQQMFFHYKHVE